MSTMLHILLRKQEYENQTLKEIHDELINYTLFEWFEGTFDHFSLWHPNNRSYYGADNKDELRKFVQKWHYDTIANANEAEKRIRDMKEQYGCNYITELPALYDSSNVLIYDLYEALATLTNHFSYSNSELYYGEDYGWCTMLPDDVKKEAEEQPENFILIECFYH